jgi:uncharacterized integral membrane protein
MSAVTNKAIPDGMRGWVIGSVAVLLVSLVLLVGNIAAGFYYFSDMKTPLWVSVLGAVSILGVVVGFGGLFLLMIFAAMKERREMKKHGVEQG